MKRLSILFGALAGLALAGPAAAEDPFKVGFVYVGPIGDLGWTYQHDVGRQAIVEEFGDRVETVYVESVPEGPDAERVMTQMALDGAGLIFATSFGFMDSTVNVASKFPDVKFEHATGYKRADNLSTYAARFYEGRAVQGLVAGRMTKSNIIGYIAAYPIPEVIRGINAAFLQARRENPDVVFKIIWAFTWYDPAKEADAARALIEQGADVVLQHTDSAAPQAAAQEAGNVITFGQASDMGQYAPLPRVSSIIDNWNPYYVERVRAAMEGDWTSADTWDGIDSGMVVIGDMSEAVPEDVRADALALEAAIAAGEWHPFTGPIRRQDGSLWLADGETAEDAALIGLDFYVEGIEGDIPN